MYYSANLMYKCEGDDSEPPLWEECIILISALDEDEAEEKAKKIGVAKECEYMAANGVKLRWKFQKIERVYLIDDPIQHGAELFSRFLKNSEAESLLTPFED